MPTLSDFPVELFEEFQLSNEDAWALKHSCKRTYAHVKANFIVQLFTVEDARIFGEVVQNLFDSIGYSGMGKENVVRVYFDIDQTADDEWEWVEWAFRHLKIVAFMGVTTFPSAHTILRVKPFLAKTCRTLVFSVDQFFGCPRERWGEHTDRSYHLLRINVSLLIEDRHCLAEFQALHTCYYNKQNGGAKVVVMLVQEGIQNLDKPRLESDPSISRHVPIVPYFEQLYRYTQPALG